ncbi:hypothetical protein O0L34_g8432 [Tuta absoluta]|nr:hypothetical protein O0L34_g8432 [Tuta absoluta]
MFRSPNKTFVRDKNINIDTEHKCENCDVVINELLAFIANKVDTLAEKGLIQICLKTYSFEEIDNARQIVLNLLAPNKKVTRMRAGSEKAILQEVIKTIKEYDPRNLPNFVAQNLNKLPPVTFDNIDVTTFLKEMALLKQDIANLRTNTGESNSSADIVLVKKDLDEVKILLKELQDKQNTTLSKMTQIPSAPPKSCRTKDKNTGRRVDTNGTNSNASSERTAPLTSSAAGPEPVVAAPQADETVPEPVAAVPRADACKPVETADLIGLIETSPNKQDCTQTYAKVANNNKKNSIYTEANNGKWTKVSYSKKKIANQRGKASELSQFNFRAVERTSSLYISRVHIDTKPEDIASFIKHKTELDVQVIKINTYNNDFNAYKVTIPTRNIDTFLSDELWPTDIVFRRYRERAYKQKEHKIIN